MTPNPPPHPAAPDLPPPARRRFAAWFARQDLFEAAAWPTSWVIIVTVALVTAGGVVATALPWVTRRVNLARLDANPLARSLFARDRALARRFGPAELERFADRLRSRLPRPELLAGCYPFAEVRLSWEFAPGTGAGSWPLAGRTLAADDPLLHDPGQRRLLRAGEPFTTAEQAAVIVSPQLLEHLAYPLDTPAGTILRLQHPVSGAPVEVPIVGVTRDPLPLGHTFLINERALERLRAEEPDAELGTIDTGPIGPAWPDSPSALPPRARAALDGWGWQGFPATRDDVRVYKFRLREPPDLRRSRWLQHLERLHALIMADELLRHDAFVQVHGRSAASRAVPPRPAPEWVAVYVTSLEALAPAVQVLAADGWLINETALAQLAEIDRSSRTALVVLNSLTALFCGAALVCLHSIQSLRARQKAAQIGMLRAMGMSDALLRKLFVVEAFMLWWRGVALGLLLALVPGAILAGAWLTGAELLAVLGDWPGVLAAGLFLTASWGVCRATATLSTRALRAQPPAQSINSTG